MNIVETRLAIAGSLLQRFVILFLLVYGIFENTYNNKNEREREREIMYFKDISGKCLKC